MLQKHFSVQRFLFLVKKELKSYFFSPMVYILSGLFILIIGGIFFNTMMISRDSQMVSLEKTVLPSFFGNMNFIFLVLTPLISMRLLAEEKKQKTLPLLLTSSLTNLEIILGKLTAATCVMGFMMIPTLIFPLILSFAGPLEWGTLFTSYLGTFLNVIVFLSVGLLASGLTENQIIAALLSFCVLFALLLLGHSPFIMTNYMLGQIFLSFSFPYHFEAFSRGVIRSVDLVYYFSFAGMMIFITHETLESRHW